MNYLDLEGLKKVLKLVKSKTYTVALLAANWVGEGPYTQTLTVEGITGEDNPVADIVLNDLSSESDVKNMKIAWGRIDKIATADGSITAYCSKVAPTVDITIQLKVVR